MKPIKALLDGSKRWYNITYNVLHKKKDRCVVAVQKKKKSWWMVPLLAGVLIYAAFTFTSQSHEMYILNLEIKQLEQKIAKEEEERLRLLEELDDISSYDNIEKLAREKLGMVKDGERVFVDINK